MKMKYYFKIYVRKTVMTGELILYLSNYLLRVLLLNYLKNYYLIKSSTYGVKFLRVLHCSHIP
jgi:hypothetical protein